MVNSSQAGRVCLPRLASKSVVPEGLVGRELTRYDEFLAANELYERVFDYPNDGFTLNPNLLGALARNGGSVVGVFAPDDMLVGFAYGFAGKDASGSEYHYSQSAVVAVEYQGQGIGRELKCLQRDVATRTGSEKMRWTFDPILTRNGHFNFSTLGAIGIGFHKDYYSRPGTDRLLVDWALCADTDPYEELRATPSPELSHQGWGEIVEHGGLHWLPLPADPARTIDLGLRPKVAESLQASLAGGNVLVGCRRVDDDTSSYLSVPCIDGTSHNQTVHSPLEDA